MFERLMLPLDLDEPSSWAKALPVAVAFAEAHRSNLTLATVISDWVATRDVEWSPLGYRRLVKDAELRLRSLAQGCGAAHYDVKVAGGAIGPTIVELAETIEADLIILSSHRPGAKDYLIGAHALYVARHARCSVFIVRH
jgi:nucleotide-binding universal stress UspA family protein